MGLQHPHQKQYCHKCICLGHHSTLKNHPKCGYHSKLKHHHKLPSLLQQGHHQQHDAPNKNTSYYWSILPAHPHEDSNSIQQKHHEALQHVIFSQWNCCTLCFYPYVVWMLFERQKVSCWSSGRRALTAEQRNLRLQHLAECFTWSNVGIMRCQSWKICWKYLLHST